MNALQFPLIAIGTLFALAIIASLVKKGFWRDEKPNGSEAKYNAIGNLLSAAELSAFKIIESKIPPNVQLVAKVRLADMITPEKGLSKSAWQTAFNKISSKHLDFVACDRATTKVLFGIELDDKSHNDFARGMRDGLVDEWMKMAGIPVVRLKAQHTYSTEEIEKLIFKGLQNGVNSVRNTVTDKLQTSAGPSPVQGRAQI